MIWLTSLVVLFSVFILPGILALGIKMVPDNDQPGYSVDVKRILYGKYNISQKFTSQENNLTAIGITIGNPNLKNQKTITLTLYDSDGVVIRTSALNGYNVGDGAFVRFIFDPIPGSLGKKYLFTLASPDAGSEEIIYVYYASNAPSWIGEVKFGQEVYEGGLPFVTYHKPQSKLGVVKSIYSSWLSRLL